MKKVLVASMFLVFACVATSAQAVECVPFENGQCKDACGNYGAELARFKDVPAYSNGDWTGSGCGQFQCVDYARRFYTTEVNKTLGSLSPAYAVEAFTDWPINSDLTAYTNGVTTTPPAVGDIYCQSGNTYGHIAIIKSVDLTSNPKMVTIIDQNRGSTTSTVTLSRVVTVDQGRYSIQDLDGNGTNWSTQGWLRDPNYNPPPPTPTYACEWVTQSPFTISLYPGQTATFTVTYKNKGTTTWKGAGYTDADPDYIELRACRAWPDGTVQDGWLWPGNGTAPLWISQQRVVKPNQATISPNQNATFTFTTKVATTQGSGNDQRAYFRLWHKTGGLIENWGGFYVGVNVSSPATYTLFTGKFDQNGTFDVGMYESVSGNWNIALTDITNSKFVPSSSEWLTNWGAGIGAYRVLPGDFSGDGYTDICLYHQGTGRWFVAYNQGWNRFEPQAGLYTNGAWLDGWGIGDGDDYVAFTGDYSGDGVNDVGVFHPATGRWFIAYTQHSPTPHRFVPYSGAGPNGSWIDNWGTGTYGTWRIFDGKLSTDSYDDIGLYSPSLGRWFVAYNWAGYFQQANGPYTGASWLTGWAQEGTSTWRHFVGQANGDSHHDIIAMSPESGNWFVAKNLAGYFADVSYSPNGGPWLTGWAQEDGTNWQRKAADISGDSYVDLVAYAPGSGRFFVAYNWGDHFVGQSGPYTNGSWLTAWCVGNGGTQQIVSPDRAVPAPKEVPTDFSLVLAPNPLTSEATITFTLPESGNVHFTIYDVSGREVYSIPERAYDAGRYSVSWNRTGRSGKKVPNGIYFLRFTSHMHTVTRRIVVVN